jgi:hypothetical protein
LSAFLYIIHALYALIHPEVCQQQTCTANSVTTDAQVFIYPDTFSNALKELGLVKFFEAVFVFLKEASPEDYLQ